MFWWQKNITYINVTTQPGIGIIILGMNLKKVSTTLSPFASKYDVSVCR